MVGLALPQKFATETPSGRRSIVILPTVGSPIAMNGCYLQGEVSDLEHVANVTRWQGDLCLPMRNGTLGPQSVASSIGSTIEGTSFPDLLTRVDSGPMRIKSTGKASSDDLHDRYCTGALPCITRPQMVQM